MIVKRFIPAPLCNTQAEAESTFKTYIKGVSQLFIDAGLTPSATTTSIDVNDITVHNTRLTGHRYMSKTLDFDMNDAGQIENPYRISLQFGTYWTGTTDGNDSYYGAMPIWVNCNVHIVNVKTGEIVITSVSTKMYDWTTRSKNRYTSGRYQANVYDAKADSFIISREGYLAICLSPGYDQYMETDNIYKKESSIATIVIERFGNNLNVICNETANTSGGGYIGYVYSHGQGLTRADSLTHYVDNNIVYQHGKIVVFPKYVIDENTTIKQSENTVIVNADTMTYNSEIALNVNNIQAKFIALPGRREKFFNNSGRILVRFGDADIPV